MNTGISSLDKTLLKTREWLDDVAKNLGSDNLEDVFHYVKAVISTLRDRLLPNEAVQLAASMPLVMKGMYYDEYKISGKPEKFDKKGFLESVQKKLVNKQIDAEKVTIAVFSMLQKRIGGGELDDIKANMPKDLAEFIEEGIRGAESAA